MPWIFVDDPEKEIKPPYPRNVIYKGMPFDSLHALAESLDLKYEGRSTAVQAFTGYQHPQKLDGTPYPHRFTVEKRFVDGEWVLLVDDAPNPKNAINSE